MSLAGGEEGGCPACGSARHPRVYVPELQGEEGPKRLETNIKIIMNYVAALIDIYGEEVGRPIPETLFSAAHALFMASLGVDVIPMRDLFSRAERAAHELGIPWSRSDAEWILEVLRGWGYVYSGEYDPSIVMFVPRDSRLLLAGVVIRGIMLGAYAPTKEQTEAIADYWNENTSYAAEKGDDGR